MSLLGQRQISGIVINDMNGEPIPFVSIGVIDKPFGTVTNQNGEFTLNINEFTTSDSLGFYFIGFESIKFGIKDLSEGMHIRMKEKIIHMDQVSIIAKSYKGRELLNLALANRASNYPGFLQKREVFRRVNSATYIDQFDLNLEKSSMAGIDDSFVKQIEDSMIRYNRHYTDHLYILFNSPDDSLPQMGKIRGIKRIVLDEEIGGEMEQIEKNLEKVFNSSENGTFWKLKTGPVSMKITTSGDSNKNPEEQAKKTPIADSVKLLHAKNLYTIDKINLWSWDFIQKPGRYQYKTRGMLPIKGERTYVVDFKGGIGQDYEGQLYISAETYAILRIEYRLKTKKAENGVKLLGVKYNVSDDSGLVIYDRDVYGYYLKYAMDTELNEYAVERPFQLIQKEDRVVFNRKTNKIDLHLNIVGRDETSNEILVVTRKPITTEEFSAIEPLKVESEKITRYKEDIWKGYSIIEPTRQMKDYRSAKYIR